MRNSFALKLLDVDLADPTVLAKPITAAHRAVPVIACAAEPPRLRVYPANAGGESDVAPLSAARLAAAPRGDRLAGEGPAHT